MIEGKDLDNVNLFLLGEYRRMLEVILLILLVLLKKDEKKLKLLLVFLLYRIEEIKY